jgi:hypothetical protein
MRLLPLDYHLFLCIGNFFMGSAEDCSELCEDSKDKRVLKNGPEPPFEKGSLQIRLKNK